MSWYGTRKASKLPSMDKSKILVFDTETTGLLPAIDEILQIVILDGYGRILFSSYIKPKRHKKWKEAEKTNHISPEMVSKAPSFIEVKPTIQEIFNKARVIVGYNIDFDINFLEAGGIIVSGQKFDVMTAFATYREKIEHSLYRKCKLIECAEYFGYSFAPHDAGEDAKATLFCFNALIADERFTTYKKDEIRKISERKPVVKKKTRTTISLDTRRRRPLLFGIILTFISLVLLYLISGISFWKSGGLVDLLEFLILCFFENIVITVITFVLIVGLLTVMISFIRGIIRAPRWIMVKIKRIVNRLGGSL